LREYLPHVADVIEPKLQFVAEYACPLIHQRIKNRHPRFDGVLVHRLASYYPLLDEHGKTRLILGVIQDASVDDFEATLRQESEERLLRVLDNLFAFVGVLELDGTLLHANRAPLEAAGIQPADVEGKNSGIATGGHIQQKCRSNSGRRWHAASKARSVAMMCRSECATAS
jgi:PAS domain-containing protein